MPASELPRVPAPLGLLPGHDALAARLLGVNALLPLRTLPFIWDSLRAGARGYASLARHLCGSA